MPDCDLNSPAANGECQRMDNQTLGQQVFVRSFDPDYVGGWGNRANNWSMGAVGSARSGASRLGDRWLHAQLVG